MKNLVGGTLLISALAGALTLNAQAVQATQPAPASMTADDVVAKHLAAIGGKDAISQVKSLSMDASVQIMGNEAPSTTVIVDGVGSRTETDFNGSKIIQCYGDKGGWTVNPMAGAPDPTPMPADDYASGKEAIYVGGELYDYAGKGSKLELAGQDAGTYKLKVTSKENVETTYVLDANTFLIKSTTRKSKMQGQDVDVTTNFSDYRKTDVGYLVPYAMDVDFGGQFSLNIAVKKVELNKTIDPAIFEMPKATPATPSTATPQ